MSSKSKARRRHVKGPQKSARVHQNKDVSTLLENYEGSSTLLIAILGWFREIQAPDSVLVPTQDWVHAVYDCALPFDGMDWRIASIFMDNGMPILEAVQSVCKWREEVESPLE